MICFVYKHFNFYIEFPNLWEKILFQQLCSACPASDSFAALERGINLNTLSPNYSGTDNSQEMKPRIQKFIFLAFNMCKSIRKNLIGSDRFSLLFQFPSTSFRQINLRS